MITITSLIAPPAKVSIDPYGPNPLAEDYQQVSPTTFKTSTTNAGPVPKMFTGGTADLPMFTASGLDPKLLSQLPYTARHYVAALPDLAVVHSIFEEHADDPYLTYRHEGLDAAIRRVTDWASGRMDRNRDPFGALQAGE